MNNKILLSIGIPTYNRAGFLEELLSNIAPQMSEFKGIVELCISNNHSKDNTREIVTKFLKRYPNLIKYNENKENLGFDKNVLKVINMAEGKFVWTFSDDDSIAKDGIKKVIKFIEENGSKRIGGMAVKDASYRMDTKTGEKIKYHSSVDKNRLTTYGGSGISGIIRGDIPYRFISVLLFNKELLKKILEEKPDLVKKGIGSYYFHSWLYLLLFLLNEGFQYRVLNEEIVITFDAKPKYKFVIEDQFELIYKGNFKFFDNLLAAVKKSDKNIIKVIKAKRRRAKFLIIPVMMLFKIFGIKNYASNFRCLKLSFKYFSFFDAVLISIFSIIILIAPVFLIKKTYKLYLRIRLGSKAESDWLETYTQFTYWNQPDGLRRMTKD